jgi:diacylglycerol kinase family enzyme
VANGLLRAGRPGVTLAVLPVGSANDYAHSLGLGDGWWQRLGPEVGPCEVDVGLVTSGARSRYFVNGLGLGFNGAVTRQSQRIRWLRGVPLYGLALLRALASDFVTPRMTVQLDDQEGQTGPTLALSLAVGRREGNFVVAPQARLADGYFDYLYAGALRRRDLLGLLPALLRGQGLPVRAELRTGRCRRAAVRSEAPLTVHTDGEFFCQPQDGVRELEARLLPRALRVFGRRDMVEGDVPAPG